jgi:proteasome beta subunit
MQGLAVVPIFAGYDLRRERGRLYQFDITGGRYEERDYASSGSGSLHASTVLKLGFTHDMDAGSAIDLALRALWHAADEDSATGGPDPIRGIYPVVATITADGFDRVAESELKERVVELTTNLGIQYGEL